MIAEAKVFAHAGGRLLADAGWEHDATNNARARKERRAERTHMENALAR